MPPWSCHWHPLGTQRMVAGAVVRPNRRSGGSDPLESKSDSVHNSKKTDPLRIYGCRQLARGRGRQTGGAAGRPSACARAAACARVLPAPAVAMPGHAYGEHSYYY